MARRESRGGRPRATSAHSAGLSRSQLQAARAVRGVLAGESLGAALVASGADDAGPARPLVHELAYGTLRHFGTLEAIVRVLAVKPVDTELLALIAVALYQLDHTRAPAFAVVDQAVIAAAEVAPAAKGLVNALLRRFLRERAALLARVSEDPVARWSHPRWWIDRLAVDRPAHWEHILEADNARPPLTLRVNPRRASREALLARFADAGVAAHPAGEAGIVIEAPQPVTALPGYVEGLFSVQDLGAQCAAPLLGLRDGMRVLDACAAPGGKATHLLELARVELSAIDADAKRLARVRENIARLGLEGPDVLLARGDARAHAWWDGRSFDAILVDAPCSASGVVRRHPDGKWLRRESDLAAFAQLQREILDALWRCLARGGAMLYATCSVFREENEAQVERFLATHFDALRETISLPELCAHDGGQLLPSLPGAVHNQDGFFYALVRKE